MARSHQTAQTGPDWPPARTRDLLKRQLEELQKFRGQSWRDVEHEEDEWQQFTTKVIIHGFGQASQNLGNFNAARWAGEHYITGISDHQRQLNFELRIEKFQTVLTSSIKELEAMLPEAEAAQTNVMQEPAVMVSTNKSGVLLLVSHSSKDVSLATETTEFLRVGLALRADQIRCSSVDGYRLPAGAKTETQLREEVNSAKVLIGLITPSSLCSPYVMFELGARWGAELPMIPLLAGVTPEELRGPLNLLNALSCSSEAQLHQLLTDLSKSLGVPAQNPASYLRYLNAVKRSAEVVGAMLVARTQPQEKMIFEKSVYWRGRNGEREGPYCPNCYEDKKKEIHLTPGLAKGAFRCGVCGNNFWTRDYEAKSARRRPYRYFKG